MDGNCRSAWGLGNISKMQQTLPSLAELVPHRDHSHEGAERDTTSLRTGETGEEPAQVMAG